MNEISSGVAFWIFDIWRQINAQLQASFFSGSESAGSPAVIWRTSPMESKVSFVIFEAEQKKEWRVSFENCQFSFGVASESAVFPEFAEGKWVSYMAIEFPNGKRVLLAERFVDNGNTSVT
jgi:hypothetical protein